MPLPSRDELRERLAAAFESAGLAATERLAAFRRALERRPSLVRGVGIATAAVMFVGVVIAVVASQNRGEQPGGTGQLVVPVITGTPRASERSGAPTVGAPPNPGAPPDTGRPETGEHPPPAAAPPAGPAPSAERSTPARSSTSAPSSTTAPSAPTSSLAAPPAEVSEHRVVKGETLAEIALRYDVPFEQIAADSGLADPNRIRPGQRLVIRPKPADVVVIQPGRTLSDYARSTGRRVADLMRLNPNLSNPNRILAGGRLPV
jgi:LysM repeat protein